MCSRKSFWPAACRRALYPIRESSVSFCSLQVVNNETGPWPLRAYQKLAQLEMLWESKRAKNNGISEHTLETTRSSLIRSRLWRVINLLTYLLAYLLTYLSVHIADTLVCYRPRKYDVIWNDPWPTRWYIFRKKISRLSSRASQTDRQTLDHNSTAFT